MKRYGHIGYLVNASDRLVELYPDMTVYVKALDFDSAIEDFNTVVRQKIGLSKELEALQQRLTAADERADVLEGLLANAYETAAKWVEKRCDDYVNEHGSIDPETGTVEFPGDGEEYVGELMEIAEGLRALKPAEVSQ